MLGKYFRIINTVGYVIIAIGLFMVIPIATSLIYMEWDSLKGFAISLLITELVGVSVTCLTRRYKKVEIGGMHAAIIVFFSWLCTIFFSSIAYMIIVKLDFTRAIFESTSGYTTTGLSVINVALADNAILMWRSLTQFLGGIGIVLVLQAILPTNYTTLLYNSEGHSEKVLPNIKKTLKSIILIYLGYFLLGVVLYVCGGMSLFDSINHSMTALATGGFSTKVASIAAFDSIYIECVTILLMLLGSINFATHIVLFMGKFKILKRIFELRVLAMILIVFLPVMVFIGLSTVYSTVGERIRIGIFESISALTGTGFTITNYSNWSGLSIFILIILMVIGGNTGSTSGGIKQYRFGLMFKNFYWNIKSSFVSKNKIYEPHIYNSIEKVYLTQNDILKSNSYILLYLITLFVGTMITSAFGYSFQDSLFEFASAIGTVGISVGITNASTSNIVLWTDIIGMFLGRLEFWVAIFAFAKIGKDIKSVIK